MCNEMHVCLGNEFSLDFHFLSHKARGNSYIDRLKKWILWKKTDLFPGNNIKKKMYFINNK